MGPQVYSFGSFQIDNQSRVLLHHGERVLIPPKSVDLLIVLLECDGKLMAKEELMKALWPDTFVEDNNLAKHVFQLRKTLGADERGAAYIETVPKRGYRFAGQVERVPLDGAMLYGYEDHAREQIVIEETYTPAERKTLWVAAFTVLLAGCLLGALLPRLRTKGTHRWGSVLIQPFTVSGDTNPSLAAAFTQEVAARLRTVRDLRVVSPLWPLDPRDPGRRPPVETILSGRLEVSGGHTRVSAQLVDANDGAVIWAEDAADLEGRDLQLALTPLASAIAARLCGRLQPASGRAWNAGDLRIRRRIRHSCGDGPRCCRIRWKPRPLSTKPPDSWKRRFTWIPGSRTRGPHSRLLRPGNSSAGTGTAPCSLPRCTTRIAPWRSIRRISWRVTR